MREIKFRAWDGCQILNDVVPLCNNKDEDPAIIEHHFLTGFRIKSVKAVLEFTGLKDKNNKEIYEGNIVRMFFNHCQRDNLLYNKPESLNNKYQGIVVEYHQKGNEMMWRDNCYNLWNGKDVEIIGNIYENPELLK